MRQLTLPFGGRRHRRCRQSSQARTALVLGIALAVFLFFTVLMGRDSVPDLALQDYTAEERVELLMRYAPSRYDSEMPHPSIGSADQVCALCTDGFVYVHVGQPRSRTDTCGAGVHRLVPAPVSWKPEGGGIALQCEGVLDEPSTRPFHSSAAVAACVEHLLHLGLLAVQSGKQEQTTSMGSSRDRQLVLDYDAEGAGVSVGGAGRCPAFLAEVRPAAARAATKMDVSYPRLPSWPLSGSVPAYFGTARVLDTDVDKDVQPPGSVELTADLSGVVMRFGRDETSTRSEPFEMVCPSHFLSLMAGRFGRQHNQLQEMMHTLALSRKTNRTFIVPVLVPEKELPYLRFDAQKVYGFNALRREGGYCLLSYAEARGILKELERRGEEMTLRRFNYYADRRPNNDSEWARINSRDWWQLPQRAADNRPSYNVDAWLEDWKAQEPPVTTVGDTRADGMKFIESEGDFTVKDVFPAGDEGQYVRMACMRRALAMMVELLCGDHMSVAGAKAQPRLAMLSARMAFYARPSLKEQTRMTGLLRPSEPVFSAMSRLGGASLHRFGRLEDTTGTALKATPTPANWKKVMGFHLRRREGTCRVELQRIGGTAFALDGLYQLDTVDPSWSTHHSTTSAMLMDCNMNEFILVELYRQYTQWMRVGKSNLLDDEVPLVFLAHDEASASIPAALENRLQLLRAQGNASFFGTANALPARFVATYDRRANATTHKGVKVELSEAQRRQRGKGAAPNEHVEQQFGQLVGRLYDALHQEMATMAVDFFVLTNTGVFRGSMLSSVSTNVVMRRWGRGLVCHGVLPGYLETYYAPALG